jgi:RecA-family ATPase
VDTACPIFTCYQQLAIDDPDALDALKYWVYDTEAKLVVVDPLLAATSGRSLRDGWNARRSLQALKRFCDSTKCAALVLHHRKDARAGIAKSRAAENDQISATASLIMSMSVKELDQ